MRINYVALAKAIGTVLGVGLFAFGLLMAIDHYPIYLSIAVVGICFIAIIGRLAYDLYKFYDGEIQ